jgi:hypothetical protein
MSFDPDAYLATKTSTFDPDEYLKDEPTKAPGSFEYNAVRTGAVKFLEGALGAGDELDAMIRRLAGSHETWDDAIEASRADMDRFEEENPKTSDLLYGSGIVGGFFVPSAGLVKVAQTGTKLQRAAKVGAIGSAEGAAYGFLAGEGEEGRTTGAALGAGIGGVLGTASGAFLTKGADVPKNPNRSGVGTHMGGNKGFHSDVGKAPEVKRSRTTTESSLMERVTDEIDLDAPLHRTDEKRTTSGWFLSTKNWFEKEVGERAAKLAEDAETQISKRDGDIEQTFDTTMKAAVELFENNRNAKAVMLRMNESITTGRASWDDLRKAVSPEEVEIVNGIKKQFDLIQEYDWVKNGGITKGKAGKDVALVGDYFPSEKLPGFNSKKSPPEEYYNPMQAMKNYAQDVSGANILAENFGIDTSKLRQPVIGVGESRLDIVIDAIQVEAGKQGATPNAAANLGNGLRSQFIAARQGGNSLGALIRRATSIALLTNPINAILNMGEWATAPIYQNGVRAWAETLPGLVTGIFSKTLADNSKSWLSLKQVGKDKQYMGELAQAGEEAFHKAAETASFVKFLQPNWLVNAVDKTGKVLYAVSGVGRTNRLGQEVLGNSAIKLGARLAKKGDEESLAELRKHPGMRGLTESEFQSTVRALKEEDLTNAWIVNFYGAATNKIQPQSAASMPKAYHDNPNARVFYSMLSYMNTQMNLIKTDIIDQLAEAQRLGLNSKEGLDAGKEAMKNSAKYAAIFGVAAGIWDDFRLTLDQGKDKDASDILTPAGVSSAFMNQLGSNLSSGLYNHRSREYGEDEIRFSPAPLSATGKMATGIVSTAGRLLTGEDEPLKPLAKSAQTYLPGLSSVNRTFKGITGKNLLTDD